MIQSKSRIPHYGGQALIEGVLMRGKENVVAVMRKPDGSIHIEQEKLEGSSRTHLASIPFIRGLVILWDSLSLGMKYLTASANIQADDEEKIEGGSMVFTVVISLVFAVGLFFLLPMLIVELISNIIVFPESWMPFLEGLFRLLILILYMWAIGQTNEIKRVFAYHGAEHKTINTFESGEELNAKNISGFPLEHPRCGTSFLLTLVFISIIFFSILGPLPILWKIISRVFLIPILAMVSYEIIKWMGDHLENPFVSIITKPNILLQKLTTREPTQDMIEVALISFQTLLKLENKDIS